MCVSGPHADSIASVDFLCLSEFVQAQFAFLSERSSLLLSTINMATASIPDSDSDVSQLESSDESSGVGCTAASSSKKSSRGGTSSREKRSKGSA